MIKSTVEMEDLGQVEVKKKNITKICDKKKIVF